VALFQALLENPLPAPEFQDFVLALGELGAAADRRVIGHGSTEYRYLARPMTRALFTITCCCLALAACSPAPTTQAAPPPAKESLTLTGPVSGQLTEATTATCAVDTKGQITQPLTVTLDGTVANQAVHIVLRVDAYLGPGAYEAENFSGLINGFSVTTGTSRTTSQTMLEGSNGTVTVVKGGTGSIDMTSGTQTLKGDWRCR
jgi:hypothetical protein